MNHLLLIPVLYFIFITTIICLIHTFVPDYEVKFGRKKHHAYSRGIRTRKIQNRKQNNK